MIAAIVAGQLQNVFQTYAPGVSVVTLIDDGLVLLALLFSLRFFPRTVGAAAPWLVTWSLLCTAAFVLSITFSPFTVDSQFALFRQIVLPALLMLIGLTLRPEEWRRIALVTIFIGIANALYIGIEEFAGPLIDPTAFSRASGYRIYGDGFPSTYHGNDFLTGDRIIRAGGLLLNPPIMALFIAVAAIIAFHTLTRPWLRWGSTLVLLAALYATNGRGGMVVAVIGLAAGPLIRMLGPWLATASIVVAGIVIGGEIFQQGGSSNHVGGLTTGLSHAVTHPLGRGFGYVGNARDTSFDIGDAGSAESLLGIAFSAIGLSAVLLVLLAVFAYIRLLARNQRNWFAAIGLGIVTASLLVESASALNGTVPIWLAAGIAFLAARDGAAWGIELSQERSLGQYPTSGHAARTDRRSTHG